MTRLRMPACRKKGRVEPRGDREHDDERDILSSRSSSALDVGSIHLYAAPHSFDLGWFRTILYNVQLNTTQPHRIVSVA